MHACPVISNYLKAFITQLEADILVFSLSLLRIVDFSVTLPGRC